MSRADKKQRHKAKREAKRREHRRSDSISPIKRLAHAPGQAEYWMSDGLDELHQAQIFVFKQAAGLTGIACFLIDKGVVGLKDAWTRMNIERAEFNDMLTRGQEDGITMRQATLDDVRRLIAGAIRWTHANGMRLPKDWAKTTVLVGGIDDWMSADVSAFALEFFGHPEDLRQRLIGEPFDSYIQRKDIRFLFSSDATYAGQSTGDFFSDHDFALDEDQEDDDDDSADKDRRFASSAEITDEQLEIIERRAKPVLDGLVRETTEWLTARRKTPSPELSRAWKTMLLASILSASMFEASRDERKEFELQILTRLMSGIDISDEPEFQLAVAQIMSLRKVHPDIVMNALDKYFAAK